MVAFIQKAHGCIYLYIAIEAQEAQLAISDSVKRGGVAQRDGGSAVAAAQMQQRRCCDGGGSATARRQW